MESNENFLFIYEQETDALRYNDFMNQNESSSKKEHFFPTNLKSYLNVLCLRSLSQIFITSVIDVYFNRNMQNCEKEILNPVWMSHSSYSAQLLKKYTLIQYIFWVAGKKFCLTIHLICAYKLYSDWCSHIWKNEGCK